MKNRRINILLAFFVLLFFAEDCNKETNIPTSTLLPKTTNSMPKPDHIVIAIEENHAYSQIIGSDSAPYINSLVADSFSAIFINSYAITYPSQPNYLDLFSGSDQGVANDDHPGNEPFTTSNLGRQLINAGKSFVSYSESLPAVGYNGDIAGAYARKHNPAANWMGSGVNQISPTTNQPFTAFPADYTKLPTVSFVIPDLDNDMHDGTISMGDSWLKNNLDKYIQWAKTHNSLFVLTFDEDDKKDNNHIVTIFCGSMVKGSPYSGIINHYNILRTIENMYGLHYSGNAANVTTITGWWR
jgi:acid phosphatase